MYSCPIDSQFARRQSLFGLVERAAARASRQQPSALLCDDAYLAFDMSLRRLVAQLREEWWRFIVLQSVIGQQTGPHKVMVDNGLKRFR